MKRPHSPNQGPIVTDNWLGLLTLSAKNVRCNPGFRQRHGPDNDRAFYAVSIIDNPFCECPIADWMPMLLFLDGAVNLKIQSMRTRPHS